jgi:adenylate kinase
LDFYKLDTPYVIHLDISEEESIKRLMGRGRIDDNIEDIKVRLSWYETEVEPAIDFYRNNSDYKFIKVDGTLPIERVHEYIIDKLNLK